MSKPKRETPSSPRGAERLRACLGWIGVAAAALSSGCAAVTTEEGERLSVRSEGFAEYVERVFREQNRVATELAFALEDAPVGSARFDALDAAEELLLSACAGLNELAAARRDGGRAGGLRGLRAARQAPACERATSAAAAAL